MNARKQCWSSGLLIATLAFTLQFRSAIAAQDAPLAPGMPPAQGDQTESQDPPGRVARLDYIEGSVSFQPGGENDWIDAEVNRPLATGDNLWADENSRAEVHIGSTALRLGAQTGISLLEVSDQAVQIRLAQGSLILTVRRVDAGDSYEVDTPNMAFAVMQPGDYRIDVDPDGNHTGVTVWRGRGEATGGGSTYTIVAGQYATFSGSDHLDSDIGQPPADDAFDSWASSRDQAQEGSESTNYLSSDMTGYEDLDAYGEWMYVEGYGECWRPQGLVVGWAPYRFGHWAWVGPWGWTWIADEPWGFAPFHYGRWAMGAKGWMWVPGPAMVRPVYAPALVGWMGGAVGFRFSFGAGVGWFPLAPGEVFIPGYRVSAAYVNRVNVTNTAVNVTTVTNVYNSVVVNRNVNAMDYANRSVAGGVTVVSRDTFVNARPVARNVVSVPAKELATAPVSQAAIEPVHNSIVGAGRPAASRPPAAVTTRQVVALRTPAPAPQSFDRQVAGTSNNGSASQQSLVRQQPPGQPVPAKHQASGSPQDADGFRPFTPVSSKGESKAPRVWEEQGTPEPEHTTSAPPENRRTQRSGNPHSSQRGQQQTSQQTSKPATAVRRDEPPHVEDGPKSSTGPQQKSAPMAKAPARSSPSGTSTAARPSSPSSKN
jgi:hypothetical protein